MLAEASRYSSWSAASAACRDIGSLGGWEKVAVTHFDRIETNPKIMLGKPVIRGTRIPVELILRKLGEGATEAELLDAYPRLTRDDIRAVIAHR